MSKREEIQATVERIEYADLIEFCNGTLSLQRTSELKRQIAKAYGPDGLGILTVSGVPNYQPLRSKLLRLAQSFAHLPDSAKAKCVDPASGFQFGWSHGIEILENGKADVYKGSFYANPNTNVPTTNENDIRNFPQYCRPNIWPKEDLPELENAFLSLGNLITEVGLKLAKVCDEFVVENGIKPKVSLEEMIKSSKCNKARLLHYFPTNEVEKEEVEKEEEETYCGVHCDHGTLTGLCSALYLDDKNIEVSRNNDKTGLFILNRNHKKVKINIPKEEIGFQIGLVSEIVSRNILSATPHFVSAPKNSKKVSRNTFAVFLQPNWSQKLNILETTNNKSQTKVENFENGMSFGEFSKNVVLKFNPTAKL